MGEPRFDARVVQCRDEPRIVVEQNALNHIRKQPRRGRLGAGLEVRAGGDRIDCLIPSASGSERSEGAGDIFTLLGVVAWAKDRDPSLFPVRFDVAEFAACHYLQITRVILRH